MLDYAFEANIKITSRFRAFVSHGIVTLIFICESTLTFTDRVSGVAAPSTILDRDHY